MIVGCQLEQFLKYYYFLVCLVHNFRHVPSDVSIFL